MATLQIYYKRPSYCTVDNWKIAVREGLRYLRSITPVLTGYLKDSWFVQYTNNQVAYTSTASYASFVDEGTKYMRARNMSGRLERELPLIINRTIRTRGSRNE
jgi:hypothetical protein